MVLVHSGEGPLFGLCASRQCLLPQLRLLISLPVRTFRASEFVCKESLEETKDWVTEEVENSRCLLFIDLNLPISGFNSAPHARFVRNPFPESSGPPE